MSLTVWERIEAYNQGREPERLMLKYRSMQNDIFSFLRGTAHLFYQDLPQNTEFNQLPLTWITGDLHLENFGSYKGDNRLTYFDLSDFDESALAPCSWDLMRFLCSLLVAAQTLGVEQYHAFQLCKIFLETYSLELSNCKARWIERSTATGMIRLLLKNLKHRSRNDLLHDRTVSFNGERALKIDTNKSLLISAEEKQRISDMIECFAAEQPNPEFFQVLDVARRVTGLGSLGLERYVILVKGKGVDRQYLLDLKFQSASSLSPYLITAQPNWQSEAHRVLNIQTRSQAIPPAYLSAINDGNRSYVLKELLPHQDRVHLRHWSGKIPRLQKVVYAMAQLVAWQHIRTAGWKGSAIADEWQDFGQRLDWQKPILDYAQSYSRQIRLDWLGFKEDIGTNLLGHSD